MTDVLREGSELDLGAWKSEINQQPPYTTRARGHEDRHSYMLWIFYEWAENNYQPAGCQVVGHHYGKWVHSGELGVRKRQNGSNIGDRGRT